ncbi:Phosphorylated adapter RNA export protein [Orchesella cincta]|uniref:Phosphorylated adapter RNA export protein n=1 Tax=Orchesella cincta TaxID=48709 RepID=A0A1D2NBJ8_ORCCI|nr:Phosphorylated adapter RNA export protein [Orchesella cincta]
MECGSSEVQETTMDVQDEEQKQNAPLERKKWKTVLQARFRHLDDNEFGNKMVRYLQEQRNPGVIQKAVQILGQDECLRLLHKTLKIRRSGGIVIKKKTRMRTTGGTFLYLIRNDKRVSSDKKEAVLHDEGLQPSTVRKNVDDKPQKGHHNYGGGITQRIMARHGGMPQPRIDLESDKFSLPSNPAEVHKAATKASTNRTEVSYDDLDLLDFVF